MAANDGAETLILGFEGTGGKSGKPEREELKADVVAKR